MRRHIFFLFLLYILHRICNKSDEVNKVCFADISGYHHLLQSCFSPRLVRKKTATEVRLVFACLHQSAFPPPLSGSLWLLSFFQISFIKCSSIIPPFSLYPRVARQLQYKREGGAVCSRQFYLFR